MSCQLAVTGDRYMTPETVLRGLEVMPQNGCPAVVGILMRDLGGPFKQMKDAPILSGIFTEDGVKRMDAFMLNLGFTTRYKISFKLPAPPAGVPKRDLYLIRAYDYPSSWETYTTPELHHQLMLTRLQLKAMDNHHQQNLVFSFWPDTILIKEVGRPLDIAEYLGLDRNELTARMILVQGGQQPDFDVDLYQCYPFFLQGYGTTANGENTMAAANRNFLTTRGFPGYNGYKVDFEISTHILHFATETLGLGVRAFKHIISPLSEEMLQTHPDVDLLRQLKYTCRHLLIDGPTCIIGCLPDYSLFMLHGRYKLCPGVVGHADGTFALASDVCGLDAVLPGRDKCHDYQPMFMDMVTIPPERSAMSVYRQTESLS